MCGRDKHTCCFQQPHWLPRMEICALGQRLHIFCPNISICRLVFTFNGGNCDVAVYQGTQYLFRIRTDRVINTPSAPSETRRGCTGSCPVSSESTHSQGVLTGPARLGLRTLPSAVCEWTCQRNGRWQVQRSAPRMQMPPSSVLPRVRPSAGPVPSLLTWNRQTGRGIATGAVQML